MAIIEFENDESFELRLVELKLSSTYGLVMAGEPTERTTRNLLASLRANSGDTESEIASYFIDGYDDSVINLPAIQCNGFFVAPKPTNQDSQFSFSGLHVCWLCENVQEILSQPVIRSIAKIPWSKAATDFDF